MSALPKTHETNAFEAARTLTIAVEIPFRDRVDLTLDVDHRQEIVNGKLTCRGCPDLLALVVEWRKKLSGPLAHLELPAGNGHADMLLREAILKAQGKWDYPYKEEELCHCRAVPTAKVDAAIVGGCRSVKAISRETSAGTSCGTCRPDIEACLNYRTTKP